MRSHFNDFQVPAATQTVKVTLKILRNFTFLKMWRRDYTYRKKFALSTLKVLHDSFQMMGQPNFYDA